MKRIFSCLLAMALLCTVFTSCSLFMIPQGDSTGDNSPETQPTTPAVTTPETDPETVLDTEPDTDSIETEPDTEPDTDPIETESDSEPETEPETEPSREPAEGLTYALRENGEGYDVTGIGTAEGITLLIIPDTYEDLPVLGVAAGAFNENQTLVEVVIPASVETIGEIAFSECPKLTTVTVLGAKTLGGGAFQLCDSLTTVYLPDTLEFIGEVCFSQCPALAEIVIPDSVTTMEFSVFAECPVECSDVEGGVRYIGKWAVGHEDGVTDVVLRDGTTHIADTAFCSCDTLVSVTIPDGVLSVGATAFRWCDKLESFAWPDSIVYVGEFALHDTNLTEITIPTSLSGMGDRAFPNSLTKVIVNDIAAFCAIEYPNEWTNPLDTAKTLYIGDTLATELVIPEGVTEIADYAFISCESLESVQLPQSLTRIGKRAFYRCASLETVNIPARVTEIGESAFYIGGALSHVTIEDLSAWCRIDFATDGSNPIQFAEHIYVGDVELRSITIPAGVTEIKDYAFIGANYVTEIRIPTGVTRIGVSAFASCGQVLEVTLPEGLETIDAEAFSGCWHVKSLNVPSTLKSVGENAFYMVCPDTLEIADLTAWCNLQNAGPDFGALRGVELVMNGNALTHLTIPAGITSIRDYAFLVSNIVSITLPAGITYIGDSAFEECTYLLDIYFGGTKAEWYAIEKGADWNKNAAGFIVHCSDGAIY